MIGALFSLFQPYVHRSCCIFIVRSPHMWQKDLLVLGVARFCERRRRRGMKTIARKESSPSLHFFLARFFFFLLVRRYLTAADQVLFFFFFSFFFLAHLLSVPPRARPTLKRARERDLELRLFFPEREPSDTFLFLSPSFSFFPFGSSLFVAVYHGRMMKALFLRLFVLFSYTRSVSEC